MSKLNPRHFALLSHLQIGGCTCNTKTPELRFHSEDCRYRLAAEIERTLLDASAPTLGCGDPGWQARHAAPQPQAAEPKGLTDAQLEASFHCELKTFLSKRDQERVMGMFRRALLAARAPMLSDGNIAEEAARIADSFTCGTCGMDGKAGARIRQILGDPMGSVTVQHGLAPQPQAAEPKGLTDAQPSFTNPLTPYGMLVRALRIVAGTTLYDMAKALLTTPAKLSSMEFGRAPVTQEFAFDVSAYFDALGLPNTQAALEAALRTSTLLAQKEPRS